MKTKVQGKKIKNEYSVDKKQKKIVDQNGNTKLVYIGKPELVKKSEVIEWVNICEFEGAPRYNKYTNVWGDTFGKYSEGTFGAYYPYMCESKELNISPDEKVSILDEIFRADLGGELHLHSDKVLEEIDINKKESELILEREVKEFNKAMIESNDKMRSYCVLHKLNPEETDCIELFNLLFPDCGYIFVDGKMNETHFSTITGTIDLNRSYSF